MATHLLKDRTTHPNKLFQMIRKPAVLLAFILFWHLMLDVMYPLWVVPHWSYVGLTFEPSVPHYVAAWLMNLVTLPFIGRLFARHHVGEYDVVKQDEGRREGRIGSLKTLIQCDSKKGSCIVGDRYTQREAGLVVSDASDLAVLLLYLISFIPGLTMMASLSFDWLYILYFALFWAFVLGINEFFPRWRFQTQTTDASCKNLERSSSSSLCEKTLSQASRSEKPARLTKTPPQSSFVLSEKIKTVLYGVVFIAVSFTTLYVVAQSSDFSLHFDLLHVYDLRAQAQEIPLNPIAKYAFAACRALVPVMLVYSLVSKDWLQAAVLLVLSVLMFSFDGMKSVVFSVAIALVVFAVFKKVQLRDYVWMFVLLGAVAFLELVLSNKAYIADLFMRRSMLLPSYLSYQYFVFFQGHELDFFRQGFLGRFGFASPYDQAIPYVIGKAQYVGGYMNDGLLADVFTNWGVLGLAAMPFLIVVLLRGLDWTLQGLDSRVGAITVILTVYRLNSSFFTTVLLTHGTLFLLLVLFIMPREMPFNCTRALFSLFRKNTIRGE